MQANSHPITPAPMISMDFGISVRLSASSLESMFFPSKMKEGICAGLEPVAIIILSASIFSVEPSLPLTSISFGESRAPLPSFRVTPQLLNNPLIPFT